MAGVASRGGYAGRQGGGGDFPGDARGAGRRGCRLRQHWRDRQTEVRGHLERWAGEGLSQANKRFMQL